MAATNYPPSSHFQKTVTLFDWWLTKPQTNDHTKTLGVAGFTSQQNRAARCFSSAPILKIFDLFELETADGVCVILQGFINKDRTLENGFSPEVFDHFVIGFPPHWKQYCPKIESTANCVTREDGKDSHEFHGTPQNCDGYTVDMGVQDCKDTPPNPCSDEISQHLNEAGNEELLCVRSHVTPGLEDDSSPITMDSSTRSKCLGVSSRRMTRFMKKSNISCSVVNDTSNLDKGTPTDPGISEILNKSKSTNAVSKLSGGCGKGSNESASYNEDTVIEVKSIQKQIDKNVGVITKDDADVSGESQIDTRISDLEGKYIAPKCSDPLTDTSVGVIDVNDDMRTNMKGCRSKKKIRVDVPQKEGAPATLGTRDRSKTKLPVRKLITSPKSAKITSSRGKKVNLQTALYSTQAQASNNALRPSRRTGAKYLEKPCPNSAKIKPVWTS